LNDLDGSGVDVVHDLNNFPYPFGNCKFNYILASHVIEHILHPIKVIDELWRIIKPNGILEIRCPNFSAASSGGLQHYHKFAHDHFRLFTKHDNQQYTDRYWKIIEEKIEFVPYPFKFNIFGGLMEKITNINGVTKTLYDKTFLHCLFPNTNLNIKMKKITS